MSSHRRKAPRTDGNQTEIVEALRKLAGVTVETGKDDLLVGYKGRTYWVEIKASSKSKLQPSQKKLVKEWQGHYCICWTAEQVMYEIGYLKYECRTCWEKNKDPECDGSHAADAGY